MFCFSIFFGVFVFCNVILFIIWLLLLFLCALILFYLIFAFLRKQKMLFPPTALLDVDAARAYVAAVTV